MKFYTYIYCDPSRNNELIYVGKVRKDLGKGPLLNLTDGGKGTFGISAPAIRCHLKKEISCLVDI